MTTAFPVEEAWRERGRAVVHADGSARPQTVRAGSSPLYHRLLERFAARSGAPFVVNTSFNVDGEPIVCTPREALRCFYASGLDALALGPFLLTKT
jgi:carbamoyltransferase